MKFKFLAILSSAILILTSCGDDESILKPTLETNDFNTTLSSRPSANLSLGKIIATSNFDDVSFNIVEQNFEAALKIDQSSGEIFVNDANQFDINKTESLEAEVEVLAGELSRISKITVDLELPETTIDYFKEIALGFENGNVSKITRKWETTMKIFLDGNPSSIIRTKVEQTIADINELVTDGFSVEIVENESLSNCYLFFGTVSEYEEIFPNSGIGSNFAIFNVWWNNDIINQARIFIDTNRPTVTQQKSLILEEITQVLGLGNDSPRFQNSIFYETSSDGGFATEYSEIDRELVKLLYHPDMKIGLNSTQTDASLRRILKSEW